MSLFQALVGCMAANETLRFDISTEGENVTLLVQPQLKPLSSTDHAALSDEQTLLRAALALPLKLSNSAAELDQTLLASLQAFAATRQEVHTTNATLAAMKEAASQAKQAAAKTKPAKAKQPDAAATDEPALVPDSESSPDTASRQPAFDGSDNPSSLF